MPYVAITSGEPAGIGPDICCYLATQPAVPAVVYGCPQLLAERAVQIGIKMSIQLVSSKPPVCGEGILTVRPINGCFNRTPGQLDPHNAAYVFGQLDAAINDCITGEATAMITAPVHKKNLSTPNKVFHGHTEYLAEKSNTPSVSMQFANEHLIAGLVTVHQPLETVAKNITIEKIVSKLDALHQSHQQHFPNKKCRIGVMGLNPHAGEEGLLGTEELTVISPAIQAFLAHATEVEVEGPLSPDATFVPHNLSEYSAILGMYHDQVLAPLKALYPRSLVNVTWGLPFLRVSVDHGTAIKLAGTGKADPSSLLYAVRFALERAHDA